MRIIDTVGFCDTRVPVEQEIVELSKAIVFAREGINAIAFVIRLDDRFSNNQASVLREWQQLSDLWDYVFVVFSHAQALGSSEDQQRRIHEFLDNGRCPQELKQLMDNVNDRFVLVESVADQSEEYYKTKSCEITDMLQKIWEKNKKVYTNVMLQRALELYEDHKTKHEDDEKALKETVTQLKETINMLKKQSRVQKKRNQMAIKKLTVKKPVINCLVTVQVIAW